VVCVDPAPRLGGVIRTESHDGFLCEAGPQAVLDNAPDTLALIEALGLRARAITAAPQASRRFIYARGALHVLPTSPLALLRSGLLSPAGKIRLLAEPFIRRGARARGVPAAGDPDDSETVEAFAIRRLGVEAARTLLGTAVIGIYATGADALSLASAFPRLAALEHDHGSLFGGLVAARQAGRKQARRDGGKGAPRGRPLSFPGGLQELVEALGQGLGPGGWSPGRVVALQRRPAGSGWRIVVVSDGGASSHIEADAVVLTVGTQEAAHLLRPIVPAAHDALAGLPTAPIAVCCLGFRDASSQTLGMDLNAYGFLVARGQAPLLLGCQYETSTFPGRAPQGGVLLRAILGGTGPGFEPDIVDRPDGEIAERAVADLKTVAGLKRAPDVVRVWKYPRGLPLYAPGHAARVAAVDQALRSHRGLFVIGHGLRGLGVNESIRAATALVRDELKSG
jgi:oxygen-dependent protoporphyrinogen oxidase